MANYAVGRFGNPMAFWIRPDVNALSHGPRVKVNSTYRCLARGIQIYMMDQLKAIGFILLIIAYYLTFILLIAQM